MPSAYDKLDIARAVLLAPCCVTREMHDFSWELVNYVNAGIEQPE